jgi:2-haloacid dehalogenase
MPAPIAVVFDAYGTLLDVHAAASRHSARLGAQAAAVSTIWRAKQLEYSWVLSLAHRYEPFWLRTERALDYAFARCPGVDRSLRGRLSAYRSLDAYPEVPLALDLLRARGLRTGILSNGDLPMLRDAVASAGLADRLDPLLSVDAVKAFKTSPRAYELAPTALGLRPGWIAFVSSNRWDIAGASSFGFRTIWVNRLGLPDEYPGLDPDAVVGSLSELAPA